MEAVAEEGFEFGPEFLATYQCQQCGEFDHDRTEHPPVALTCHACHAGSGMDLGQMITHRTGMLRVQVTEE